MFSKKTIQQLCQDKIKGIVATVVDRDGLGPAQVGDCLFWAEGHLIAGTVGGGSNEKQVLEACEKLIEDEQIIEVSDTTSTFLNSCGGSLRVQLKRLDLRTKEDIFFLENKRREIHNRRIFLFGAGHVVREVCWLATRNQFDCTVVDLRKELLQPSFFPESVTLVCDTIEDWTQSETIQANDFLVIAGPDHATDLTVLEQLAKTEASYIGVVGSNKKIGTFKKILIQKDCYQSVEKRLYAPIGIKISSKRPSEVAVSIVAELITIRAQSSH